MMMYSERTKWAIGEMRYYQHKAEESRTAVSARHREVKEQTIESHLRTHRETYETVEKTAEMLASRDTKRREIIADEQWYRSLATMYAGIAQVELSIDEIRNREQQNTSIRDAGAPCTE